jgi:hypothetical protein
LLHKPKARRMLSPAWFRNQFDSLGKALAQYMPVLKYYAALDEPLIGSLREQEPDAFEEISLQLLKPWLFRFRKCLLMEGFQS